MQIDPALVARIIDDAYSDGRAAERTRILALLRNDQAVGRVARAIEESVCDGIEAADIAALRHRYQHARQLVSLSFRAMADEIESRL